MPAKTQSAGDHILSHCSKCKDATNHTIVAMVGSRVARVECNVCNSVHNHRGQSAPSPRPASPRPSGQPRKGTSQAKWKQMMDESVKAAVPYSIQTHFKTGDILSHPAFGLGKVTATIGPNKMEVMFEQGVKMLRCAITGGS